MVNYHTLMDILSVPRPNGSAAETKTRQELLAWLRENKVPCRQHVFRVQPFFFECIGLWLLVSRLLLALSVSFRCRRRWTSLILSLLSLIGGTIDLAFGWPLVSWFGTRDSSNLLMEFEPPHAEQEIVLCGHFDSKTELLDHEQRRFFTTRLGTGATLTILAGMLGMVQNSPRSVNGSSTLWTRILRPVLIIPMLVLAWGLGLNLLMGRFGKQSQGAVDNGAACAILLDVAHRLASKDMVLKRTRVTITLFTAEEQNMQGSRAYVRSREWSVPVAVINLELMAQDGPYVVWHSDGNAFRTLRTTPSVNAAVHRAVVAVTGMEPQAAGTINSDAFSFLSAGVPATVLGTFDRHWHAGGLHRPSDCLERVDMTRLSEGADILMTLLKDCEQTGLR
jgi:hypothetical protein